MSARILIVGATSSIARAVADTFARRGDSLILAARDADEAARTACDLRIRHRVEVDVLPFDAENLNLIPAFFERCLDLDADSLQGVFLAQGAVIASDSAHPTPDEIRRIATVNYTSSAILLALAADHFGRVRRGWICAVSSIAGDRGRQSNAAYAAAKSALSTHLSGLRQRLAKSGVSVTTIKPGFVDTAATYALPGLFLVATPEQTARDIIRAIDQRAGVVYTPWFWRWIMLIIRTIPEPIFKRMKL